MSEVKRALQSFEEFVLCESLDFNIIHVRRPFGGVGKICKYVDLAKTLTENKGTIRINNTDDLQCAREIVTVRTSIDKHALSESI